MSRQQFNHLAKQVAQFAGRPVCFTAAILLVLGWLAVGPVFDYSDTWQLVINTGTTIVTFLMVFLIQNTQNRDTSAIQIKLDELIRVHGRAHNAVLDLEELDDETLENMRQDYERLATQAREHLTRRRKPVKNGREEAHAKRP
jgi:low affinity Fe/Cu permease